MGYHEQRSAASPDEATFNQLLRQAKSPDPDVRFEAIGELNYYRSPEVDEALVQAAFDPDRDVASMAVDALSERDHPQARGMILEHLRSRPTLSQSALRSAGVVDISPHLDQAWLALEQREWVERTAGAGALAQAGVVSAIPKIRELAHRGKAVRQLAAEAHLLGSAALLGDSQSADLFVSRLSSRSRASREAAAYFLDRRGRVECLAQVVSVSRLRSALLSGMQIHDAWRYSFKPSRPEGIYSRTIEDLLRRLDALSRPS